jgi:hypothetical protein
LHHSANSKESAAKKTWPFVRGKFGTGPAWAECRNAAEEHDERLGGLGWPRPHSPTLPRIPEKNVLTAGLSFSSATKET